LIKKKRKKKGNGSTKCYYHKEKSAATLLQSLKPVQVWEKKYKEGFPPAVTHPSSVMGQKSPTQS